MKPYRVEKITELIKNELSVIIQRKIFDPRIRFVSIQAVDLSRDLRMAKIHITTFGDLDNQQQAVQALNNAKGYIKTELAKRVFLRFLPELEFMLEKTEPIITTLNEDEEKSNG